MNVEGVGKGGYLTLFISDMALLPFPTWTTFTLAIHIIAFTIAQHRAHTYK